MPNTTNPGPTMNLRDMRFGVEIEIKGMNRLKAAQIVASVVGGTVENIASQMDPSTGTYYGYDCHAVKMADGRKWTAVNDGSLGTDNSAEVVTPICTWADMETIQKVVRALRAAGGRVDQSCGLHVHVGVEALDGRSLINLARMMAVREPVLKNALGIQDARWSHYASQMSDGFKSRLRTVRTKEDLNRAWYGGSRVFSPVRAGRRDHYHNSRYHGLNLHTVWYMNTVEFRYFEGTLHAGEVKAAICLAVASVAAATEPGWRQMREGRFANYAYYQWLHKIGLSGEEFRTVRYHLVKRLRDEQGRPYMTLRTARRTDSASAEATAAEAAVVHQGPEPARVAEECNCAACAAVRAEAVRAGRTVVAG